MGNLGIKPTLLAGCESQGNRYDYKVYIILNIKLHLVQSVSNINISQNIATSRLYDYSIDTDANILTY